MATTVLPADHARRIERARLALDGLSVGDSFGQRFFAPEAAERLIQRRELPYPPWRYTDDTEMSLAIFEVLHEYGEIEQDALAATFARRYAADPRRGYGSGAHAILQRLCGGEDWREVAPSAFRGQGSMGNGGAMRVAPVGAYFADDFARSAEEAAKSAVVTHAHPEGQAGAVATAVATAFAWQWRESGCNASPSALLETVLAWTPDGATRRGIQAALDVPLEEWEYTAANLLGNGSNVTAPDTVGFCLWCAAAHLNNYTEALLAAMRVGGDIDTNCAIVGGIVAMAAGRDGIPDQWLRSERVALAFQHRALKKLEVAARQHAGIAYLVAHGRPTTK